jgi:hypothetical protein
MNVRALLVVVVLGVAPSARAYRPFDETDADVAEPNVLELELGPTQFQWAAGRASFVPSFIINYGVVPDWEVVLDTAASGAIAGPRGTGETFQFQAGLAMKHVLRRGSLQDGTGLSVAIEPELLFPDTSPVSGVGVAAGVILSQRWTSLTAHLNLVPAWNRAHHFQGLVGVIVEGPNDWAVRPVGELYVQVEPSVSSVTVSGLVGVIWRASKRVSPDFAIRVATEGGTSLFEVRLGITWDIVL